MNEKTKHNLEVIYQKWLKCESETDDNYIMQYCMYMGYIKALVDADVITQEEFNEFRARME